MQRSYSPPVHPLGVANDGEVQCESAPHDGLVANDLVGVVVVKAEEDDGDRHEDRAGRRQSGEDSGVVLHDALDGAEGVQVRPVLRRIRRGDEGDEAHVLGHEDGARNQHARQDTSRGSEAGGSYSLDLYYM